MSRCGFGLGAPAMLLLVSLNACSSSDKPARGGMGTGAATEVTEEPQVPYADDAGSDESTTPDESSQDPVTDPGPADPDTTTAGQGGDTPEDAAIPPNEDPEDAGVLPPPAAEAGSAAPPPPPPPPPPPTGPDGCVYFVMPSDCTNPPNRPLPSELRCTGLYADWTTRTLACGVKPYRPAFELYSDGAQKQRWYSVPEGMTVDASNPEAFLYPVGTQFWKEFRVAVGDQERLVETRLLRKSVNGWLYTSYVWDETGQTAVQTNDGALNVNGSDHDVPSLDQCKQCHSGRADYVLGWDPLMLGPGAVGAELDQLVQAGVLANAAASAPIPGMDSQAQALGYLHANCGISCHNPDGDAHDTGLFMRLDSDKLDSVESTPAFITGFLKVPWENAKIGTLTPPADVPGFLDFYPFRADASLVLVRMQTRGSEAQMPPIATKHVDEDGVAKVSVLVQ